MATFTASEKAECAEREVKQRTRVYIRLVAEKKMSIEFANRQIDIMKAIAADYREMARTREPQGSLL